MLYELDDTTKNALHDHLSNLEATYKKKTEEADLLNAEIVTIRNSILSFKRILNIDVVSENPAAEHGRNPRAGTVTDEIRKLFESNPQISCNEVVQHVKSKFPGSKIGPQSFALWNSYFRNGRYFMEKSAYRNRYGAEPPY